MLLSVAIFCNNRKLWEKFVSSMCMTLQNLLTIHPKKLWNVLEDHQTSKFCITIFTHLTSKHIMTILLKLISLLLISSIKRAYTTSDLNDSMVIKVYHVNRLSQIHPYQDWGIGIGVWNYAFHNLKLENKKWTVTTFLGLVAVSRINWSSRLITQI